MAWPIKFYILEYSTNAIGWWSNSSHIFKVEFTDILWYWILFLLTFYAAFIEENISIGNLLSTLTMCLFVLNQVLFSKDHPIYSFTHTGELLLKNLYAKKGLEGRNQRLAVFKNQRQYGSSLWSFYFWNPALTENCLLCYVHGMPAEDRKETILISSGC